MADDWTERFPPVPHATPDGPPQPETPRSDDPPPVEPVTAVAPPQPWWGEPVAAAEPTEVTVSPPVGPRRTASRMSRRGATLTAGAAVLALVSTGVGAAIGVHVGERRAATGTDALGQHLTTAPVVATNGTTTVEAVAAVVQPAVVSVEESGNGVQGTGSGFVIDSAHGYILTNNHVVSAAAGGGTLTVHTNDGRQAAATVVGRDPTSDIAVIQVHLTGLTEVRLGNSDSLKVGQTVVAFGSPLGLQGTVTSGIVSALDRPVSTQDPTAQAAGSDAVIDAIQTDAAINPGNSGGPLVDGGGRVIGINSAIATVNAGASDPFGGQSSGNIGVGFAIPVNAAKSVADQIIATGHAVHPVIKASIGDTRDGSGAVLQGVVAGGPADRAGLRGGDVITAVGGKRITDADSAVVALRKDHKPGDKVEITYVRGTTTHTTTLTLAASAPSP